MNIPFPRRLFAGLSLGAILFVAAMSDVQAGPYILAGTDADDHGGFDGTSNVDGWLFMQRALENLAPGVTTGTKKVTILGSSFDAAAAATSAFAESTLVGSGWTIETVAVGGFATFFGAGGSLGTGILMMDSGINVGGGVDGSAFVPYASAIDTFLGSGGGLFSQANGYGWLSALIPGLGAPGAFASGLSLTPSGTAAFPGLTDPDLSAGPFHNTFTGVGAIPVLAVYSGDGGSPVIIGSSGGTIKDPDPVGVPDAGSFGLVYLVLGGLMVWFRRRGVIRST